MAFSLETLPVLNQVLFSFQRNFASIGNRLIWTSFSMSSNSCVYIECKRNRKTHSDLSFFRFPMAKERRDIWLINSGNPRLCTLSEDQLLEKRLCATLQFILTSIILCRINYCFEFVRKTKVSYLKKIYYIFVYLQMIPIN